MRLVDRATRFEFGRNWRENTTHAYLARGANVGNSAALFLRDHSNRHGMNFSYDAYDWLGRHPYQSQRLMNLMRGLSGSGEVRSLRLPATAGPSGCHEFVPRRCVEPVWVAPK
jgi:hypothetical protein